MKTLFTDIYNKIMELFRQEKSENTGGYAANRLQVILMHDRTKLDPLIMNMMREELIDVFSKYVVIDKEELEIGLKQEGSAAALMLNIPIVRAKTEEELIELRKKLNEDKAKTVDEDKDDNGSTEKISVDENTGNAVSEEAIEIEEEAADDGILTEDEIIEEEDRQESLEIGESEST